MKNYIFTVWLIMYFFFFVPMNSVGMEMISPMTPPMSPEKYFIECKKIDDKFNKKLKNFIEQVTDHTILVKTNKIKHKLQAYEQDVVKQKEIAFSALKIRCNIDDFSWKRYLKVMYKVQKFREKCMRNDYEDVIHDIAVPEWFLSGLKKQLVEVGFNPQQTHIYNNEKVYMRIVPIKVDWFYENGIVTAEYKGPGEISINCETLYLNHSDREEGRLILLAHMMKFSQSINILDIIRGFGVKCDKKEDVSFVKLLWMQSLLRLVLKDQRSALCLKSLCRCTYSSMCSIENYKRLSSIDFCWRALEWLKKYSSNNSIPVILVSKERAVAIELNDGHHGEQKCDVCHKHGEDMRDISCDGKPAKNFICRKCYNKLDQNVVQEKY